MGQTQIISSLWPLIKHPHEYKVVNNMRTIFFLMILLLALAPVGVAESDNEDEQIQAEIVMQNYYTALKNGDVNSLKSLLDGELLKKRIILLNNPTYPKYLKNTYQGSTFNIVETRFISQGKVAIIAKFSLGNQQTLCRKFLLARDRTRDQTPFRIFSEIALSSSD
jgi:hypothetical protein